MSQQKKSIQRPPYQDKRLIKLKERLVNFKEKLEDIYYLRESHFPISEEHYSNMVVCTLVEIAKLDIAIQDYEPPK